MKGSVIIIGPAHPYAADSETTFDQRLAREFIQEGYDCVIYSFSLQYPLLPLSPERPNIPANHRRKDSLHPLSRINSINLRSTGGPLAPELRRRRPDIIVVRFWLPFMGPALGTILRKSVGHSRQRSADETDRKSGPISSPSRTMSSPTRRDQATHRLLVIS